MFDFVNSPTVGQQQLGPSGAVYQWDGTKWVAVAAQVAVPSQGNVGRNLVHNALFAVAQRGAGPFTVSGWMLDRWLGAASGSTMSVTQTALTDADRAAIGDEAARRCLQCVAGGTAGAGDYVIPATQTIEDVSRLAGKTVTLSFWAKANTGTPKLGIDLYQDFGSGGSPSAGVKLTAQAVTLSATWARYTTTWNMPSIAGKTLGTAINNATGVQLWMSSGATNNTDAGGIGVQSYTLQLWGIQLEIAAPGQTQPTPLERIEYADDLRHCQRFYWNEGSLNAWGYQTAGQPYQCQVELPVRMRAMPTIALGTNSNSNLGAVSTATSFGYVVIWASAVVTGGVSFSLPFSVSADL